MSDSRLEKFIYAICSMDVTDLPVPLSRIEKLWNCLITGETPDFEPLSRNENYLMALLDRYDISNLPAPMSRGEKLLYKIAVGETDLSDVPDYLSRYEELLKYLIENGGISGGDFEYVLYTLNQSMYTLYTTAEKPVKSAILSGNTLVNLAQSTNLNGEYVFRDNFENLNFPCNMIKPSTTYTIISNIIENSANFLNLEWNTALDECAFKEIIRTDGSLGIRKFKVTSKDDLSNASISIRFFPNNKQENGTLTITFMILEGDYTNIDIPSYFEGMQSVKMPVLTTTGKNLFNNNYTIGKFFDEMGIDSDGTNTQCALTEFMPIKGGVNVKLSNSITLNGVMIFEYDANKKFLAKTWAEQLRKTQDNTRYYRYRANLIGGGSSSEEALKVMMMEYGTQSSLYEPYKTNILSCNEEVELRGIGDVKDELDCLTGEVTQRIGEIVLDDTLSYEHAWGGVRDTETDYVIGVKVNNHLWNVHHEERGSLIKCDKLRTRGITSFNGYGYFLFYVSKSVLGEELTNAKIREYILSLNATVQYPLATPVIKTVDLTVVDQDNQPTQLGTFENVTHVSLESAGLVPEVEMEVATKLLEDTVFNLTNAFNTLYPTTAKPVVDGTLTGQTLVNLQEIANSWTLNANGENASYKADLPTALLKPSTKYLVKFNKNISTFCNRFYFAQANSIINSLKSHPTGAYGIIETSSSLTSSTTAIHIYPKDGNLITSDQLVDLHIMIIEYQQGMENWDIPYFEGMQSVQAPGITMTNEDNTKSATLSTPSDLELRKVGEVQDEVNVMTGEVVERIGEYILNGSELWDIVNNTFRTSVVKDEVIKLETEADRDKIVISCDRYSSRTYNDPWTTSSGNFISLTIGKAIVINDASFTTVEEWKEYLSQNPLTIKFVLATPTTKTVDLTVINQDGNETKLRTFDDTTHVLLQSKAGPNPGASLTVRTKIPSASSTSLLMDDISTEQEQFNTTVDEQSNNVDATMIATTEIYEETL